MATMIMIEITKEKNPKDKDKREDNNQKRLGEELPLISHMIIKYDCYS